MHNIDCVTHTETCMQVRHGLENRVRKHRENWKIKTQTCFNSCLLYEWYKCQESKHITDLYVLRPSKPKWIKPNCYTTVGLIHRRLTGQTLDKIMNELVRQTMCCLTKVSLDPLLYKGTSSLWELMCGPCVYLKELVYVQVNKSNVLRKIDHQNRCWAETCVKVNL